jgi:2-succinyl-5-enolpyruvyl-6-hydroxy-3-cyclohexene-1-carboxylate synthase
MVPRNLLTEWARVLLTSFADTGVTDVVVSPGSRSTPFVAAAVREPRLSCHSVVDERAAAFFALGQARLTGRPSLLICTSGTAGAHYLPAILEAQASFVPIVVLTADRPPELQYCAAAQTIDQLKLFGDHVRAFFDLGTPDASEGALRALRRMAAQATFASQWPTPGAVHVNARARKPLEPADAATDEERALRALATKIASGPIAVAAPPERAPAHDTLRAVASACRDARRGLILCGPAPASQAKDRDVLLDLARATGFPLVAESTSQLRFGAPRADVVTLDAFDALLRADAFRARGAPEVVVHVGAPLVSGAWERAAAGTGARHIVLGPHGWSDPHSVAELLVFAEPAACARALLEILGEAAAASDDAWAHALLEGNDAVWKAVDHELVTSEAMTEGHVARALLAEVPRGSVLIVGNSLAVRTLDLFCPSREGPGVVLCQRGVSGIDGLVAGAAGAGTKSATPVTLLLGDVSLVHDLTSLALARGSAVPLLIVVLQNAGGRIFEQLPIASAPSVEPEILDLTVTPHALELSHAGPLFGVTWQRARTLPELHTALRRGYENPGCTVVEAVVAPHGAREQSQRLASAVHDALARMRPR